MVFVFAWGVGLWCGEVFEVYFWWGGLLGGSLASCVCGVITMRVFSWGRVFVWGRGFAIGALRVTLDGPLLCFVGCLGLRGLRFVFGGWWCLGSSLFSSVLWGFRRRFVICLFYVLFPYVVLWCWFVWGFLFLLFVVCCCLGFFVFWWRFCGVGGVFIVSVVLFVGFLGFEFVGKVLCGGFGFGVLVRFGGLEVGVYVCLRFGGLIVLGL